MIIRGYLRASTSQQDAQRAREELKLFIQNKGHRIASYYAENISGTTIERPELNRLINDSESGDILLVEKVDRLSRLPYEQWQSLKSRIRDKGIRILVVDQPMTHAALEQDEGAGFLAKTLTDFMIDLAASMARDDYDTRRKRQQQGIQKAKQAGVYKGRQPNKELHQTIIELLSNGVSWSRIQSITGCSRSTISRVKNMDNRTELPPFSSYREVTIYR